MSGNHEAIAAVRQSRYRRQSAAKCLAASQPGAGCVERLEWSMLAKMPDWCLWPQVQRDELVMLVGALALAGEIQMCIDGRRVEAIVKLLGQVNYERVMAYRAEPRLNHRKVTQGDIKPLLGGAGAAVLLACSDGTVPRDLLGNFLPPGFSAAVVAELSGMTPRAAGALLRDALNYLQAQQGRARNS